MGVLPRFWHLMVALRITWCLVPQTGYLHPDEFFQSTQVVAGDMLALDVERPWEFNASFPVRSIVMPYITCAPGYFALRQLKDKNFFSGPLSPPAEWLLIAPRISVLIMSLVTDVLVMRTADNLGVDVSASMLCYATSYILHVFYTRTFTNTLESFLMIALLYYCTKRKSHQFTDSVYISLITTAGVFNRPTFPAFAAVPLIFWMCNRALRSSIFHLIGSALQCVIFTGVFSVCFILCDTLYFRGISIYDLLLDLEKAEYSLRGLPDIFIVTPLNFLLYNMEPSNLADHGLHPRFTHFIMNLPMLFGPGSIAIYYSIVTVPISFVKRKYRSLRYFLLSCIVVPVLALSLFPHQEARFLIPLLPPFCLLCGPQLFHGRNLSWKFLRVKWLIFNVCGALLFGCLHQGGVIRSLSHIQSHINKLNTTELQNEYHIIYFHTYMPPNHLLGQPLYLPSDSDENTISNKINIHDLKGSSIPALVEEIASLSVRNKTKIILVTPTTVTQKLCLSKTMTLDPLHFVWPHLSMEDPPDIGILLTGTMYNHSRCVEIYDEPQLDQNVFSNLLHSLSLDIFYVTV